MKPGADQTSNVREGDFIKIWYSSLITASLM